MKRIALTLALAAALLAPAGAAAHHVEFPSELEETLELLPDGSVPTPAGHDADEHSDNMFLVANWDDGGTYRQGSDLAFWGTTAVLGNFGAPGGFRLVDISDPSAPREIGQFECPGPQADVSIWKKLAFVSVDSPRSSPECGAGGASTTAVSAGQAFEGIRVVDISDPTKPKQIAFVDTDCGSHTNTLVPDEANDRLLVYVLSYPLSGQGTDCNAETHRQISVVEVPLKAPAEARVVSTPDVSPAIGCHDVTVDLERGIAGAACLTESQLWDISDPVNPVVMSHIVNPAINIHHSSTFSWSGDTLVIGDELGGAVATPGCVGGDPHLPLGALWFYDVSNPATPTVAGSFRIPQDEVTIFCTAHNFNVVPTRTGADVLVSAWYNGGTTVLDFTDPANVEQIGYYIPKAPKLAAAWSSYWYRGFIYANNFDEDVNSLSGQSRGLDVFAIGHPDLKNAIKVNRLNPQTVERPASLR
ncbi:MAG TPA: hypothetical protein VK992_02140 [Candidatus Caenarcaniphilales bacterium]|nr:hypothetical protein [Candidatus Caenarcaniphilales bacterium]